MSLKAVTSARTSLTRWHGWRRLAWPAFTSTSSAPSRSKCGAALFGGLLPAGLFKRLVIAVLAAHAEKKEPVALDALAALFRRGYFVEMPEHPQTIGYALTDTPVGLAAWMLDHDEDSYEKISRAFLDGNVTGGLTPERVVDNITLHWLTNTAASSARLYWENFEATFAALAAGKKPAEAFGPRGVHRLPRRDLPGAAQLGREGVSQPDLLQRGREGRPLRRVGRAGDLRVGAERGVQVTPLADTCGGAHAAVCAARGSAYGRAR